MPYDDVCTWCHGRPPWNGGICRQCRGTGKIKPYRRPPHHSEKKIAGWDLLPSAYPDVPGIMERCCVVCLTPLNNNQKKRYCSRGCKQSFHYRLYAGVSAMKRSIIIRDGCACVACGTEFMSPIKPNGPAWPDPHAVEMDHEIPLVRGGPDSPKNCRILCPSCHKAKSIFERRSPQYARN